MKTAYSKTVKTITRPEKKSFIFQNHLNGKNNLMYCILLVSSSSIKYRFKYPSLFRDIFHYLNLNFSKQLVSEWKALKRFCDFVSKMEGKSQMWKEYKNHWQDDDCKHKTWWLSCWPGKPGFCTGLMRGGDFKQRCPLQALMSCCHQASSLGTAAPPVEEQLPEGLFSPHLVLAPLTMLEW